MKKVFRALTSDVCEKMWLGDTEEAPGGWHATTAAALRAYGAPAKAKEEKPAVELEIVSIGPPYDGHAIGELSAELKRRTGKGPRFGTKKADMIAALEAFDLAP